MRMQLRKKLLWCLKFLFAASAMSLLLSMVFVVLAFMMLDVQPMELFFSWPIRCVSGIISVAVCWKYLER